MKVPIFDGKRSRARWMLPLGLAALLLFGGTVVFAASGGGHDEVVAKGWVVRPACLQWDYLLWFPYCSKKS